MFYISIYDFKNKKLNNITWLKFFLFVIKKKKNIPILEFDSWNQKLNNIKNFD